MAVVNLYNLFTKVSQPSTSVKDKLEFQTMVNKLACMEAKVQDNSSGPQVIINITRAKDKTSEVIEGIAVKVEESNGA
jgi:hypothetical protein